MRPIRRLTLVEQTASVLRQRLAAGDWKERLPGVRALAEELNVSSGTVQSALRQLEKEGIINPQGAGRRRTAGSVPSPESIRQKSGSLRVAILLNGDYPQLFLDPDLRKLENALEKAGHRPFFEKTATSRRSDPGQFLSMLYSTPADAWIAVDCSRKLLEAVEQGFNGPFFAWGGRNNNINLAGTGGLVLPALRAATQRLLELGHRRIVLACQSHWRKPAPSDAVRVFCEQLALAGVAATDFHVPDWTGTKEGFAELLRSLFSLTPPTAMIIETAAEAVALISFLASRGMHVPRHLSLIVTEMDPALAWNIPAIAHFKRNIPQQMRRIIRWVDDCATGAQDREGVFFDMEFVDNESVGRPLR